MPIAESSRPLTYGTRFRRPCYDLYVLGPVVLVAATVAAVISLVRAIRVGDRALEVISKSAASLLFVALGAVRVSAPDATGWWLLGGLACCAVGDLLLLGNQKVFGAGVLAFLFGHGCYIIAFGEAAPVQTWPLSLLGPLTVAALFIGYWLWPKLGRRRLLIVAYIGMISAMMWGGVATVLIGALPRTAAFGALLFYLSDLAVARQRFVREAFINRAFGLPAYYAGQILIAFTIVS